MTDKLAVRVARAPRCEITAIFQRHVSRRVVAVSGTTAGGRWAPTGSFPVLYLGRPIDSVVVEAYRHLVDSVEGMRRELVQPRSLWTCSVSTTNVLDLRSAEVQRQLGLDGGALTTDVGDYKACQAVGRAAHQLAIHGILAPSATTLGETLALFTQHLPSNEMPVLQNVEHWETLPADPRAPGLRIVGGEPT